MIRCEECNKKVSSKAKTCPRCGHPLSYEWDPVKGIFSVIAVFIGGGLFLFVIGMQFAAVFGENTGPAMQFAALAIFAWFIWKLFLSDIFSRNLPSNTYGYQDNVKLQSGEDFQFKSSFDLLEGFKENPTSQMYTDLTVAINLYTKKYPKFTSTVNQEDFKNYINWAIQETDNVFKDEPQKSKIQKESLTKLLNKLNKKITTTNE